MKESNDLLQTLASSVISIYDIDGNEIPFEKCEIRLAKSKYASTKKLSPTLFLDGIPYRPNINKKYKVKYKCLCGSIYTILLCKFLVKTKLGCVNCANTDEEKIAHQKEQLQRWLKGLPIIRKKFIEKTGNQYNFENETEEFKEEYYKRIPTLEEFDTIKPYITIINGINVENKEILYFPHENCPNQLKYRAMVKVDNKMLSLQDIYLKCENCGRIFHITRKLKERILNHNFKCKECYLTNYVFSIRVINQTLNYQSQFEYNFIQRCIENNIEIVNGQNIEYLYKGKKHFYQTDFYLPKYKKIIEIKDNHVWHKKQIENGKWLAKENAARKFCDENNLTYHLLFPKDIDNFFSTLKEIV